jgi:excinuclease ABC subunit C
VLSHAPEDGETLEDVFSAAAGRRVRLRDSVRDVRARWLQMARQTADTNLQARLSGRQSAEQRLQALREALALPGEPQRIECFDISHSSGEATVASCVVFDAGGARKSDYRRFNIADVKAGDDYAAMHQALTRRFRRLRDEEAVMPDILLIDGGKGQVSQALAVLDELAVQGVEVVGVAKGSTRKAGFETLVLGDSGRELQLPADHPAPAPDPAGTRRGAPFRDHRSSQSPRPPASPVAARVHPGCRQQAAPGASAPFRQCRRRAQCQR